MGATRPALACVLAVLLSASGCDDTDEGSTPPADPDPFAAITGAAERTVQASPADLRLEVRGLQRRRFIAAGTVDLRRHRFLANIETPRPQDLDILFRGPIAGGEYQTFGLRALDDVLAEPPRGRASRPCGLDPHLPLGSVDGLLSLEESIELTWAIARALRHPLGVRPVLLDEETVAPKGAEIGFRARISRRQALRGAPEETRWMLRPVLRALEQPISVGVADGRIAGIAARMHRLPDATRQGRYGPNGDQLLVATFQRFHRPLRLPRFDCIAME
jgi:hypothetical protein